MLKNSKLVKTLLGSGIVTAIKMASGIVINKSIAILFGPTGIAFISQFYNFIGMISNLSTGATQNGIVKYVSEYEDEETKVSVANSAIKIGLIISFLFCISILIFNRSLSLYIFSTYEYRDVIFIFALTIPFFALNIIFISIINGFKYFRQFVKVNLISSLLNLILTVSLIYFFNLRGALYSLCIGQLLIFLYSISVFKKEQWIKNLFVRWDFNTKIIGKLMKFGIVAVISAILSPYSQITVRNLIIHHYSMEQAGWWDSINKISGIIQMLITTTLGVYYLPRLSELSRKDDIYKEIKKIILLLLPIMIILFFILSFCGQFVMTILFSQKFLGAAKYLPLQFLGDFFKVLSWIFAYITIAKAKLIQFIILEVTYYVIFILLNMYCVRVGLQGVVLAYVLSYFLNLCFSYYFFRKIVNEYK